MAERSDPQAVDQLKSYTQSATVMDLHILDDPTEGRHKAIKSTFDLLIPSPVHTVMKMSDIVIEPRKTVLSTYPTMVKSTEESTESEESGDAERNEIEMA